MESTPMKHVADRLPIAVIGAGPVGLAAANLVERGLEPLILETGPCVAASMWDWGHVRLFTPWSFLIDPAGRRLLEASGDWQAPDETEVPYGKALVEAYLAPLAALPELAPHIKLAHA